MQSMALAMYLSHGVNLGTVMERLGKNGCTVFTTREKAVVNMLNIFY